MCVSVCACAYVHVYVLMAIVTNSLYIIENEPSTVTWSCNEDNPSSDRLKLLLTLPKVKKPATCGILFIFDEIFV